MSHRPLPVLLFALLAALLGGPPCVAAEPDVWLDSVVLLETGPAICAGVLIDEAGTVATAYHCVASGRRPRVEARDGAQARGTLLATAPREDIALVSVPELAGRPWLPLAEEAPRPGDAVWALGHPFGTEADRYRGFEGLLRWSVSAGIVSAVGPRLVQVDAALNPGNSGGPVVDEAGRVVGISSRKLRADNLGFIAPAALVAELVEAPEHRTLWGGSYALGVAATLPTSLRMSTAVGLYGELALRDRLVVRVDSGLPLEARRQALALGETWWLGSAASLSGRIRIGRGRWSTALDLGVEGAVFQGREAQISPERIYVTALPVEGAVGGVARLSLSSAALRWQLLVMPDGALRLVVGIDAEIPGNLGVF
ncbi:MAG: trypsin-like peptidase domain-containing protein [Alphaproteobacteria bacterium]|nr:trypsin-like peptidase domain-containing protein [Alphaproteobacteria bacterium]